MNENELRRNIKDKLGQKEKQDKNMKKKKLHTGLRRLPDEFQWTKSKCIYTILAVLNLDAPLLTWYVTEMCCTYFQESNFS